MSIGSRCIGHTSAQRPQCMHAVGAAIDACRAVSTNSPLSVLRVWKSVELLYLLSAQEDREMDVLPDSMPGRNIAR